MELSRLLDRPFAHRGLHRPGDPTDAGASDGRGQSGAAENSLDAVEAAVRRGLGVEIDVQLSRDGVTMLHHDSTLLRVCGDSRPVRSVTAKDLTRLRLGNTDATVPTAAQALEVIAGRVPLLLDLKCAPRRSERRQLAEQIAMLTAGYDGPVAVVGFDPFALAAVATAAPWVLRGQSGGVPLGRRTQSWAAPATRPFDRLWFAPISRPHFVSYNVDRISATRADRLRDRLPLVGWTFRCTHQLKALQGSLDQVIVEGPAASDRDCRPADVAHFGFGCTALAAA